MKYIYICGPTVYDHVHIGNLRPIVTFDIFIRSLKYLKEDLYVIHNITDIDDKIITAAKKEELSEKEIAKKYLVSYQKLISEINIETIDFMPSVISEVPGMICFIKKLITNKKAYIKDGDVYFRIDSFPNYGSLSNQNQKYLISQNQNLKNDFQDFALWKKTSEGINFNSPWSKGRPGWHTECAYFLYKYAKKQTLFYHGGGIDLIFPHHENENAQFESITNKKIAKNWKHVGQVNINNQKMSKSLNNTWIAKDFFKKYDPDFLRFIFLSSGVTNPLSITTETLENLLISFQRFKKTFLKCRFFAKNIDINLFAKYISEWKYAQSLKWLNLQIKEFNINNNEKNASYINAAMKLLGFNFAKNNLTDEQKDLYYQWKKARKDRNFDLADKLRNHLTKMGII